MQPGLLERAANLGDRFLTRLASLGEDVHCLLGQTACASSSSRILRGVDDHGDILGVIVATSS